MNLEAMRKLKDKSIFLKEELKHPSEVGGLIECGKNSANLALKNLDLKNSKNICLLGCGMGEFCYWFKKKLPKKINFFGVEINEVFNDLCKKRCPDFKIYQGDAINLRKFLKKEKIRSLDIIISRLPWVVFTDKLKKEILGEVYNSLSEKGEFLTIAYLFGDKTPSGKKFKKLLKEKFSKVKKTKIEWKNLPPVFYYHCKK